MRLENISQAHFSILKNRGGCLNTGKKCHISFCLFSHLHQYFFSDTKMRWTCLAALALGLIATTHGQDTQDCPADFVSFEVVTGMLSISNFTKKRYFFCLNP